MTRGGIASTKNGPVHFLHCYGSGPAHSLWGLGRGCGRRWGGLVQKMSDGLVSRHGRVSAMGHELRSTQGVHGE